MSPLAPVRQSIGLDPVVVLRTSIYPKSGSTNVEPGVLPGDAVNLGQMRQAVDALGQQANDFAAKGVASSLAMPAMPALAAGKQWVGLATRNYANATAIGQAWGYQVSEGLNVGAGISATGGSARKVASRVQLGYAW